MSTLSPLLDFFKRGEVARDVRMLAAQGVFAPRAHEQLAILILLLDDTDPEIRSVATDTLNRIPETTLKAFLARSDVSVGIREFFADRGVFPAETPAIDVDTPLIDVDPELEVDPELDVDPKPGEADAPPAEDEEEDRESILQKIAQMNFPDRVKAAVKGTREMRAILIRDPNKLVSASVLSSPKVTEQEIEGFARMANMPEDVLRIIGHNRVWLKNYGIVVGLTKNPKTPLAMSMNLMVRLNTRDLSMLAIDRNVPEALRIAARKRAASGDKH